MTPGPTRRAAAAGLVLGLAGVGSARAEQSFEARCAAIEASHGGRLGVAVIDTASGRTAGRRAHERFPMCSTFKLLAVAAVLARVDRGQERLDRWVRFGKADLLANTPVTGAHVAAGGMTLGDLCAAAIEYSDNTAANLILASLGGPAGYTRFARSLGDNYTRLDRIELELNTSIPGDPRDTTTPSAMAHSLRAVLVGDTLSPGSRRRLIGWLKASRTGEHRLRAGLPDGWTVGDKTGTGAHGSTNDIGILWPPGRAPILAAAYFTGSDAPLARRETALADVGRALADWAHAGQG
jgi:beta-lactamase class A